MKSPNKCKNMTRIHWEKEDRIELEKSFANNPHPDAVEKQMLADKLRVPFDKIHNFFKNKRQKLRRSGASIKRVFHEDSPVHVSKAKRTKKMQSTPEISTNLVKTELNEDDLEREPAEDQPSLPCPVMKLEKDDPDYQPDETVKTTLCSEEAKSTIVISDTRKHLKTTLESSKHLSTSIQSLPPFTPIQQTRFIASTPIIPTYLPIQSPYLEAAPSCFDSTAIQYFPIYENSSKPTDPIEHEKNLDQILENNLNHLDESKDTGIEDAGFEILSEPEQEIEIKPLPSWFPFSVLYPNQPLFPNQSNFHFTPYYQGYPSIYQKYIQY